MLKYIFYLCIGFLTLGQLSLVFRDQGLNVYIFDVLIGVFCLLGLAFFINKKKALTIPKYLYLFFIFLAWTVVSNIFNFGYYSIEQILPSMLYLVRFSAYLLGAVISYNLLETRHVSDQNISNAILISGLFISLIGIAQLIFISDFEKLDPSLGWDPHKNRIASTFFDPNFTGGYLVICLTILLDKIFKTGKNIKKLDLILFLTYLLVIFLTFSRSAWMMLGFVIMVYGLFKDKRLLFAFFIIIFSAYFAVPRVQTRLSGVTDPSDSARFRLTSWNNALGISNDNLLMGVGFNFYRFAQKEYGFLTEDSMNSRSGAGSDSSFLLVLATTGIVGLIIFGTGFLFPLLDSRNLLLVALIGGLVVETQFINSLFYPQIMFLWMLLFSKNSTERTLS